MRAAKEDAEAINILNLDNDDVTFEGPKPVDLTKMSKKQMYRDLIDLWQQKLPRLLTGLHRQALRKKQKKKILHMKLRKSQSMKTHCLNNNMRLILT